MPTQNYICPNCQGKGCPVCQNTGQLTLSDQEVQELQKLMTRTAMPYQNQGQNFVDQGGIFQNPHEERHIRGQVAGVLTLLAIALISVSGFLSWFYTHTFKPFFQFWTIIVSLLILRPVSKLKFFQEEKSNDYLDALCDEGINIKISPLYPLI